MTQIRALVVDDEPLARRGVRQLLASYPDVTVVGECRDGREAVRALAVERPDLVFLDVEMPGLDGLDVIGVHGAGRMPYIVFITAHQEYAVQAFETQALDYLIKPLSEARFRATMDRFYRMLSSRPPAARIAVPSAEGEILLDPAEIDWIEAEDDHAVIHAGQGHHRVRQPLAALEARLDRGFVRVHRSAIVRLDRVREVRSHQGETALLLRDGVALPVSRRRAVRVKALLQDTTSGDRSPHSTDRSPRGI
ncbi:MAG TPA: LytTR family DNA-binding domain-containing protein [Gemmatimonadales bacterium]